MPLRVAVIHCGSSKVGSIREMLEHHGAAIDVIALDDANLAGFDGVDGIVISGGPVMFTRDREQVLPKFCFVERVRVPTLGICLGHQAIAVLHGARVFRGEPRTGPETIRVLAPHALLEGFASEVVFEENHEEGVSLPEGFDLHADSAHCAVEVMACRARPLYGVQFHPEVSGDNGRAFFGNFLRLL